MHDDPTSRHGHDEVEQVIDSIVDKFVEQALVDGVPDVEAACARYPEFADRIRQAAASLKLLAVQHSHLDGNSKSLRNQFSSALGRTAQNQIAPTLASSNSLISESDRNFDDKYRLREELGEGGFGVVYVAEQLKPVRRKVAIKVVKPGMDSKEVLARFDAERQALAMMDHPNVAKVLDGGMSEDGRPFFVMELIRGIPITAFCNSQELSIFERLKIFRDTCLAVQHAHIKGIIHRDIKPSNVLVTMRDDTPVAKVIDFGVAKAFHTQLTDATVYTAFGQMVGTPIYMSPEQIQLSEQDVDIRSDVYSLGVLLYELITGDTPFTRQTLVDKGIHQFRELVCESEPPRPSSRISTVRASDDPTVVDQRRYASRELKRISGELDWIVLKSLEKNRSRRYQSCSDFAKDIDNFLSGDIVTAKPPTVLYRISKTIRRNKGLFAASSAVLAALLLGLAGTYKQMIRAEDAELEAQQALKETEHQRKLAEDRLELAENAVDDMYVDVANKWIQSQAGKSEKQREFLEKAAGIYRQLAGAMQSDSRPQQTKYAKTLRRVASIEVSLGLLEQSVDTAQRSSEVFEELHAAAPADLDVTLLLAESYYTLARSYRSLGNNLMSLEWADKAANLILAVAPEKGTADQRSQLSHNATNVTMVLSTHRSKIESTRNLLDLSETLARGLLKLEPDNSEYKYRLVRSHTGQGISFMWWGRENEEAAKAFQQAKSLLEELRVADPDNIKYLRDLQTCTQNLSVVFGRLGQSKEVDEIQQENILVSRELVKAAPDQWKVRDGLRGALRSLALRAKSQDRLEEARRYYEESSQIANTMRDDFPEVREAHMAVLAGHRDLASLEVSLNNFRVAAEHFSLLIESAASASTKFPNDPGPIQYEFVGRSFTAWTSAQLNDAKGVVQSLDSMVGCLQKYARVRANSGREPITAFKASVPMCELALKAIEEMKQSGTSDDVRRDLSVIETELQSYRTELVSTWCELVAESENPFKTILRFSESYEPPPKYMYGPFDLSSFNAIVGSSEALGWRNLFQMLAQRMDAGDLDAGEFTPGHLFVLCSAPDWIEPQTLRSLMGAVGERSDAEKQSRAWCLYRLGEYEKCSNLLESPKLTADTSNHFVRALVAWELGEHAKASELLQQGSEWLDAREKEIRADRESSEAHLRPHFAALNRLRYEADLRIKSDAQKRPE